MPHALRHRPVAVASEPSSRSSTGTSATPSDAASSRPEEPLAAGAHDHRAAGGDQLVEVGEQGQVVLRGLAEADARVDPDLVDPGVAGRPRPARPGSRGPRRPRRRSGGRPASCAGRPACASPPSRRRRGRHLVQRGGHVVDERGAGGDGRLGHLGVAGVDRDPDVRRPGLAITGSTRRLLLGRVDRLGARAGSTRRRRRPRRPPRPPAGAPWATAAAGSRYRPPSENESGVTFRTPITSGSTSGDSRDGAQSFVAHAA